MMLYTLYRVQLYNISLRSSRNIKKTFLQENYEVSTSRRIIQLFRASAQWFYRPGFNSPSRSNHECPDLLP